MPGILATSVDLVYRRAVFMAGERRSSWRSSRTWWHHSTLSGNDHARSTRGRHMRDGDIVPESAHNIELVGHTDQGGRGDGVQVMVARGHAYVGTRVSRGVMVTDVRDPRHPKPVNFMPIHPNSWCMHLQTAEDLLLCIEELDLKALLSQKDYYSQSNQVDSARYGVRGIDFSAGMRVYDIADPPDTVQAE